MCCVCLIVTAVHNIPVITAAASTSNSNPVAAMMIEVVELTVSMCNTIMNHKIITCIHVEEAGMVGLTLLCSVVCTGKLISGLDVSIENTNNKH